MTIEVTAKKYLELLAPLETQPVQWAVDHDFLRDIHQFIPFVHPRLHGELYSYFYPLQGESVSRIQTIIMQYLRPDLTDAQLESCPDKEWRKAALNFEMMQKTALCLDQIYKYYQKYRSFCDREYSLQELIQKSPEVETLTICNAEGLTDRELEVILGNYPRLKSLSLKGGTITHVGATHIARLANLLYLRLENVQITSLAPFCCLKQLRELTLCRIAITDLHPLYHFPRLERLEFCFHPSSTAHLESLLPPHLKTIIIESGTTINAPKELTVLRK